MYLLFERIGIRRILDKDRISHRQQECFQIRFLLLRQKQLLIAMGR